MDPLIAHQRVHFASSMMRSHHRAWRMWRDGTHVNLTARTLLLSMMSVFACHASTLARADGMTGVEDTDLSKAVSDLAVFQAESGGFRSIISTNKQPSVDATYNALLIASLYGQLDKVNVTSCTKFIYSLENSDGGFSKRPGRRSDVKSVWLALLSLQYMRLPTTKTHVGAISMASVVKFVRSPYGIMIITLSIIDW